MSIEYLSHNVIGKHFFKPKPLSELKDTATIVIDTNVLLSAYQWKEVTLKEVKDTLEELASLLRLKIPSHVVKEFMDQRPKRIVETNQKIENTLLSKFQKLPKLISTVPFLEMLPNHKEYLEAESEYNEAFDTYKKKIQEIIWQVKDFINSDPVLDNFEQLILSCYYQLEDEENDNMENELKERVKKKIPPLSGGDSGKKENFDGDFVIWRHILKLETDVIFVTSDTKPDWVIKDHHNNVLSPRRELIEEFYLKSSGNTFAILSPKDFVKLFNSQINNDIVEDLSKNEEKQSALFNFICNLFSKHDPVGIDVAANEYEIEARYIIRNLPAVLSLSAIEELIHNTFEQYFNLQLSISEGYNMAMELFDYLRYGDRSI